MCLFSCQFGLSNIIDMSLDTFVYHRLEFFFSQLVVMFLQLRKLCGAIIIPFFNIEIFASLRAKFSNIFAISIKFIS